MQQAQKSLELAPGMRLTSSYRIASLHPIPGAATTVSALIVQPAKRKS